MGAEAALINDTVLYNHDQRGQKCKYDNFYLLFLLAVLSVYERERVCRRVWKNWLQQVQDEMILLN